MTQRIVLLLAHSIEEHDQLKLLFGLGYDVFSIGGYIDPANPHDPKRPALSEVQFFPELKKAVDDLGTDDNLEAAKCHIPDAILEWADTIIVHHCEQRWIGGQWDRIKNKRVIWRTVGQSVENNERQMAPYREEGLQVVRYSPKEENIPGYVGADVVIRFYKDPEEWFGWRGEVPTVINFTQNFQAREPYTNWGFWSQTTRGLPAESYGPGSKTGELTLYEMKEKLRANRAYLYTGTQPASYTLGLIEAMMVGIPIVSIGPAWMNVFPYGPDLFEGHEIADVWSNSPSDAKRLLVALLTNPTYATAVSEMQRKRAIGLFGKEKIGREWSAFLGAP